MPLNFDEFMSHTWDLKREPFLLIIFSLEGQFPVSLRLILELPPPIIQFILQVDDTLMLLLSMVGCPCPTRPRSRSRACTGPELSKGCLAEVSVVFRLQLSMMAPRTSQGLMDFFACSLFLSATTSLTILLPAGLVHGSKLA